MESRVWALFTEFADFLWTSFLLLSPMLLLGLLLAGFIHILISKDAILRWFRQESIKSVSVSAAVGVPMPLCSCSVVPVVAEMRRKGASRSSCMSMLITAPETGADSILVTSAFFGFVPAVVRPFVSFITAVAAGIFCIGLIREDQGKTAGAEHNHNHDHHDHDCGHDGHDHSHTPLFPGSDDCYVTPSQLKSSFVAWLQGIADGIGRRRIALWVKPEFYRPRTGGAETETPGHNGQTPGFPTIIRHAFRYGFVEVADDILFALLVGVALGGILYLFIPTDLMNNEYARWISYPVMVLVGIPLYICASASTPIAAALVAKGFSPGAALIFLMTGPATNTGTIAIIMNQFGTRFASVYVSSVIAVTLVLGIVIDMLLIAGGITLTVNLNAAHSPALLALEYGGAIILLALIVWRFRAGALKSGYQDLMSNLRPLSRPWREMYKKLTAGRPLAGLVSFRSPLGAGLWLTLFAVFLVSGFRAVPPDSVGYGRIFGRVVARDLEPGLRYVAPWPIGAIDVWPVREVKSLRGPAPLEFLSGDLNLLTIDLNVQYRVNNAYEYHYRNENSELAIMQAVRDEVRSFVSINGLDDLLNISRRPLELAVAQGIAAGSGENPVLGAIDLVRVNLQAVRPVEETMNAFREISSSQEDRDRYAINAQRYFATLVPRAFGNSVYETMLAEGQAFKLDVESAAESEAIQLVAEAVLEAPDVLQNMLWREKLETALGNRRKVIVPSQESLDRIALWRDASPPLPAGDGH